MRILCRYLLITGLTALASAAAAQDDAADAAWLARALELRPGSVVAEIGAGDGGLSVEIARRIGPAGRIYSSELGEGALQRLRRGIAAAAVGNVTVVEGDPSHTNLPEQCCDAVFLRNVYHHFADPVAMNAGIRSSLRPGGRLAVIDFSPRGPESERPEGRAQGAQHGIRMGTLVEELEAAGFEVRSAEERPDRAVYVVARRPDSRP
jgi:tRNA A58 N-methylase Trm61